MSIEFKPIDLNPLTVNRIFNKCLYTASSKKYKVAVFQHKSEGHEKDSEPVFFDEEILTDYEKILYYMLGQVYSVRLGPWSSVAVKDFFKKYNGNTWTDDGVTLMKLIHLALATQSIESFNYANNTSFFSNIKPTLSPRDPNFLEWYEKYCKLEESNAYYQEYYKILPADQEK